MKRFGSAGMRGRRQDARQVGGRPRTGAASRRARALRRVRRALRTPSGQRVLLSRPRTVTNLGRHSHQAARSSRRQRPLDPRQGAPGSRASRREEDPAPARQQLLGHASASSSRSSDASGRASGPAPAGAGQALAQACARPPRSRAHSRAACRAAAAAARSRSADTAARHQVPERRFHRVAGGARWRSPARRRRARRAVGAAARALGREPGAAARAAAAAHAASSQAGRRGARAQSVWHVKEPLPRVDRVAQAQAPPVSSPSRQSDRATRACTRPRARAAPPLPSSGRQLEPELLTGRPAGRAGPRGAPRAAPAA